MDLMNLGKETNREVTKTQTNGKTSVTTVITYVNELDDQDFKISQLNKLKQLENALAIAKKNEMDTQALITALKLEME